MSTVNNGPQIVRNGLVLNLDASSVTSYSAISVYKVECYSTFGGGLRSANYTVQYSDDNSTWTTAFTGVMSNNSSCGIITGTNRNDSNYSKHRYWRYVEGGAVVGHHPRVSRIDFITKSGAVYNLVTYTTDNCADSGTYIVGTVTKDFGGTTWRDTSGSGNNGTFGASTAAPTYSNQNGGSLVFDGSNDYITTSFATTSGQAVSYCGWVYSTESTATYKNFVDSLAESPMIWWNTSGQIEFDASRYTTTTVYRNQWVYVSLSKPAGNSSASYYVNGVLVGTGTAYTTLVSTPTLFNRGAAQTWKGNGAVVQIYNRALTASEVAQNYQATKTRFGL